MSEPSNIDEAILAIQREVGPIEKKGKAAPKQGGYAYRRSEDVMEAVKPLIDKYGIRVRPTITSELVPRNESGLNLFVVKVDASFEWKHVPSGTSETVSCSLYAGNPAPSQATGAGTTYAWRYTTCNLLSIPEAAEDPEALNYAHNEPMCTEGEVDELREDASALSDDSKAELKAWMQTNPADSTGVPILSDQGMAIVLSVEQLSAARAKLTELQEGESE